MHVLILEASFFRRVHYTGHIGLLCASWYHDANFGLGWIFFLFSSWGIPGMGIFISLLLAPYILDLTFDGSGI